MYSRPDLNRHILTDTTPSRWRVYQFHHVSFLLFTNINFSFYPKLHYLKTYISLKEIDIYKELNRFSIQRYKNLFLGKEL